MNQDLTTLSLAGLTAVYNTYATKPIKKFTCSKAEAITRVEAVLPKPTTKAASAKPAADPAKAAARGIGGVFKALLIEGKLSNKEILDKALAAFPTSKATLKHVYWWRSALKSEGAI